MPSIPSVNVAAVLVAAVASFISGGIYWVFVANRLTKLLGGTPDQGKWPTSALIAGFLTRIVGAFVLAVFLSYVSVRGVLGGVALAWLACIGFVITMLIGQAAFRRMSWTDFAVTSVQLLLEYAVLGTIIGASLAA